MVLDLTRLRVWFSSQGQATAPPLPRDGVVIGTTEDGREVIWPAPSAERASHVLVFAASGAGKSVLVALALLTEQLQEEEPHD